MTLLQNRLARLEQAQTVRAFVGSVVRRYMKDHETHPLIVRRIIVIQPRYAGDPAFSDADRDAMDQQVHAQYGPGFVGAFA